MVTFYFDVLTWILSQNKQKMHMNIHIHKYKYLQF